MQVSLQIAFNDAGGLNIWNITKKWQIKICLDVILALDRIIEEVNEEC